MVDDMSLKKWRPALEKRRVSRKACETSRIAGTGTEDLNKGHELGGCGSILGKVPSLEPTDVGLNLEFPCALVLWHTCYFSKISVSASVKWDKDSELVSELE